MQNSITYSHRFILCIIMLRVVLHKKGTNIAACHMLHANFLLGLIFDPKDGGIFPQNVGWLSTDYTALYHAYNKSEKKMKYIFESSCFLGQTASSPSQYLSIRLGYQAEVK
jgi:hypothetical protein